MVTILTRIMQHTLTPAWRARQVFPAPVLHAIAEAIRLCETRHRGEIRFAVEAALDFAPLVRQQTAHERAIEVFSQLNIWDTEHNNGVLIYLLLADRNVEIIADRGINRHVGNEEWQVLCQDMERAFRAQHYQEGVIQGIHAISAHITRYYPAQGARANELPDQPVLL